MSRPGTVYDTKARFRWLRLKCGRSSDAKIQFTIPHLLILSHNTSSYIYTNYLGH